MIISENIFNKAIIYSDSIDPASEGIIKALCGNHAFAGSKIRIMPDVHAGKGCVIGTAMTVTEKVPPSLIGVDIGCGISVTKLCGKRIDAVKLDKLIREKIPFGMRKRSSAHRFADMISLGDLACSKHIQEDKALLGIGTLGGGNHFIEIDKGEDGALWLIIHSGSRHLGAQIASYYQNEAYKRLGGSVSYELAYAEGELLTDYLHDMDIAMGFASLNRRAMADEIMRGMKWDADFSFECPHNYIDTEQGVLRKGAVSAKLSEDVVIPLNMRDGCLICKGKGNPEWNFSSPHGAGRIMSRSEAKSSFTLSQYKKEMKGIYSTSVSRETIDESPMAYKPMEDIISKISPTVEITERILPVYNFKAGEND